MSDTSLSSADMLICNLPDHQVIRIEGRNAWMNRISERLVASYPDSLVLDQAVSLASAQQALAKLLNVINDAAFIQQALKAWLDQERTLLLVVNPTTVESNALTYLLGLPSICNEQRSAVTIVLLSTDALLAELKANHALAAKLDGYYQEEASDESAVESKAVLKTVAVAAGVACLCAGAWHLYQTQTGQQTPDVDRAVVAAPATKSAAKEITPVELDTDESAISLANPEAVIAPIPEAQTLDSDPQEQPQDAEKTTLGQQLLADLSGIVKQARASLTEKSTPKETLTAPDRSAEKAELAERLAAEQQEQVEAAQAIVEEPTETVVDRSAEKAVLAQRLEAERKVAETTIEKQLAPSVETVVDRSAEKAELAERLESEQAAIEAAHQAEPELPSGSALQITQAETIAPAVRQDFDEQRTALIAGIEAGALKPKPKPLPKVKPEPVKPKPAKPKPAIDHKKAVLKVFDTWHKAWAGQDWDAYIGSYLQNTTPYGVKMDLDEWRAFRKERLLKPQWIKLTLGEPILTRLDSHWYRIEFYQRFEKPGYADETTKRLELTLTSSGWRIASEAANGTIVLKRPGG